MHLLVHLICTNTQRPGDFGREAYFNSTSWLHLFSPISLHKHVGFSFRTCSEGQIFSQTSSSADMSYTQISMNVLRDGLLFTTIVQNKHYESKIQGFFFDNSWHNVNLIFKLGELTMSIDDLQQVMYTNIYLIYSNKKNAFHIKNTNMFLFRL